MGQIGALRLQLFNHPERFLQAEMGRMVALTESIYDQERANGRDRSQGRSTDLGSAVAAATT